MDLTPEEKLLVKKLKTIISSFDREKPILIDTRQTPFQKDKIMQIISNVFGVGYHSPPDNWRPEDYPFLGYEGPSSKYQYLKGYHLSIPVTEYPQIIKLNDVLYKIKIGEIKTAFTKKCSLTEI